MAYFLKDFAQPLRQKCKFGAMVNEQIKLNTHFNKIYKGPSIKDVRKGRKGVCQKRTFADVWDWENADVRKILGIFHKIRYKSR